LHLLVNVIVLNAVLDHVPEVVHVLEQLMPESWRVALAGSNSELNLDGLQCFRDNWGGVKSNAVSIADHIRHFLNWLLSNRAGKG